MSDSIFNQGSSLFDEINKKIKDSEQKTVEEELDEKMNKRNQTIAQTISSIDEVRTEIQNKEISIRKSDRDKDFHNRRLRQAAKTEKVTLLKDKVSLDNNLYEDFKKIDIKLSCLQEYIQKFYSQDILIQFEGLICIRKALALANNPPIQEVIDAGLVLPLLNLLDSNFPEIVYESLWSLTNIAGGNNDYASSIVVKGGIPKIINLIDSPIMEIQEQAVWCLGNLASESNNIRDKIIALKGLDKIVSLLAKTDRNSLIKNIVWSLTSFCRPDPPMAYETVKPIIDLIFKGILKIGDDPEFLTDATWLLSYFTDKYKSSIKKVIESNFLPIIMNFLNTNNLTLQIYSIKIIGNIVTGNPLQTQAVIDSGIIPYLAKLIFHEKRSIRKETCWVVSNIAAGTQQQIKALIVNDFLPILEQVIKNDESEIQKEAIWATCNLTSIEHPELMEKLFNQGILELICYCVKHKESKYIAISLEALANLLQYGKSNPVNNVNPVALKLDKLGVLDYLEGLQRHHVEVIYEKTIKILETYFVIDDQAI